MDKSKKKLYITLVSLMMLAFVVTGCFGFTSDKEEVDNDNKVVFEFGDYQVSIGEIYVYSNTFKERYESEYGEEVWQLMMPDENGETISMVDLVRKDIVESIVRVKTLVSNKDHYQIKLTSVDQEEIKTKASEIYNDLTDQEIEDMHITTDIIETVLSDNKISDLVYKELIDSADIKVSDEEARMTTFYDLFFPSYKVDSEGNVSSFTESQKEKQHENAINVYGELLTSNIQDIEDKSIEGFALANNLTESAEYTMSPGEIKERYGESICDALYSLNDDSYSMVINSDYGYHIFYMRELTDENATADRKEQMVSKLEEEKFQEKFSGWKKSIDKDFVYPDSVNMDIYNQIEFK